ncbi:MAG: rhodanese-like domain-containing protein [Pseudomonadota bacterium]|jgi:rhodanese-related sulfurtransferase|nr:rhodanese-like domain-containing protein [Pseudomonadota bacterium]MEC8539220.1 rhodanese-like domain-containing protein [Pseudomonadota bacterium]MEC8548901.1 rhodanese-like domain-containing protein [Pseudomonadota bacterium]
MPVTQHVAEMIAAARLLIDRVSVHEAAELQRLDAAILIDLRDVRELQKLGTVANSFHAPRGMLEFWADPNSPYHKPIFRTDKKLILFCASGLRSALAVRTLQEMGMKNVLDMEGGFTEWRMQDLPVDYLS